MRDNSSSNSGIGFVGLLTILFIALKLCKVIDWSWWWVLSPVLAVVAIVLVVLTGVAVVFFISLRTERRG